MPLSETDFLWETVGHDSATTSHVVTHPDAGGTSEGSTVLVLFYNAGTVTGIPAGFVADTNNFMYRYSDTAAAETSWTFTTSGAVDTAWYMAEVTNLSFDQPMDVRSPGTAGTNATGTTRSSGSTVTNAGYYTVGLAFWGVQKVGAGDAQSWSGYTNGYTEVLDSAPAGTGRQLAVARKFITGTGIHESTATFTTNSGGAPSAQGYIFLYRSADSPIYAPLSYVCGFEWGTHGGMGNVPENNPYNGLAGGGTVGTHYLVSSSYARDTGYGLRLVNAVNNVQINMGSAAGRFACGFNIRVVSATGSVVVAWLNTSWTTDLKLRYDATTSKFGLQWGSGVTEYQPGTTALDTWVWVDIRIKVDTTTYHADWTIETDVDTYTAQTSPADVTGATIATTTQLVLGTIGTSDTYTAEYDDVVTSGLYQAYPLGPHKVRLLVPETTGATVSGTSGNFSKFTANGTLAAWAGDAGALLDDVPPTVSASSDGVVQTAVAASDYMNFPMTTYTAVTTGEIIAGVRALASLWGGTGTGTGTLGFRGHNGTAEVTFVAASTSFDPGSLTAISATYPLWYSAVWNPGTLWTQAQLDAAALRVGFSTDATPDMGVSALYLEVATRDASPSMVVHRLTDDEDPEAVAAKVTEVLHPYASGVRTYTVSNDDATRTAELRFYETGGAEHADSPVVVAPTDPPVDVVVSADAFGEIESTTFGWQ